MTTSLEAQFWSKVNMDGPIHPVLGTPCWLWTGKPSNRGYGRFAQVGAHRISYEWIVGPIPEGQTLDHLCHTLDQECRGGLCAHRLCVNPAHLEVVSVEENIRRGRQGTPNRAKTHCPAGHPYEGENLILNGTSRICRACRSARRSNGIGQGGRQRAKTHCPQGHLYDEANTYIDPQGKRKCRACRAARQTAARSVTGE